MEAKNAVTQVEKKDLSAEITQSEQLTVRLV